MFGLFFLGIGMTNVANIIYSRETPLSDLAKTWIDEARAECHLSAFETNTEDQYKKHVVNFFWSKFEFLSQGDYTFTFKTCQSVEDVTEDVDTLGFKKVYRVSNDLPIVGLRNLGFAEDMGSTATTDALLTDSEALQYGYLVNRRGPNVVQEGLKFHFDVLEDLIFVNKDVDVEKVYIKQFVPDDKLPVEATTALMWKMAERICLNTPGKFELALQMAQNYNNSVLNCDKYREKKENKIKLTQREKWIRDISNL